MPATPRSCGCAECSERRRSTRNYGDGSSMPRFCRWKRKIYIISAMVSGFLLFTIYSFSFCCCVIVNSGLEQALQQRSRIIFLDPDDPNRYEKDVADLSKAPHYKKLMRKTLLEESETQRSRRHSNIAAFDDEDVYGIMPRTEDDDLNGYTVDDHEDLDSEDDDLEYDGRTKSGPKSGVVRTKMRGTKKLPQALIIGVKKGGTRALLEFLRVHPDIRAPGPEPHFFDRHYSRGLDWYRKQMPKTLDDQITIEKTPCYFVTKGVPGRVFNMSRDIKLIVVVRDPVTRAISDYTQAGTKRPDIRPFEEMAFIDNQAGLVDTSWGAIRIGVYAKHLERWLKYFPLSQMHFANGERLISDPVSELEKIQDFLGLKRVISDKHFYFNSTRGFPCLKKPEGSGNPHCLGKTKGRVHPDVDPKVIKRLRDFYRPFNAKFYQMTNIDFGWP